MNDMIDPSVIQVVNSPNALVWPITTGLTKLELTDDGVNPVFSARNTWPDVTPPGWMGPLQFTLWLFMKMNGVWVGSGIIQYWRELVKSGGAVYKNDQIARNWVYDGRWGTMAGHQPALGETIGFMVSAGNARNQDNHVVEERSQIVTLQFPSSAHSYDFSDVSIPVPPVPIPTNQLDRIEANTIEILKILKP